MYINIVYNTSYYIYGGMHNFGSKIQIETEYSIKVFQEAG